jgi:hypothetical protein
MKCKTIREKKKEIKSFLMCLDQLYSMGIPPAVEATQVESTYSSTLGSIFVTSIFIFLLLRHLDTPHITILRRCLRGSCLEL